MRSFATKSTTSDGKHQTEAYSDAVIQASILKARSLYGRGLACILVGSIEGLDRHIERMTERLKFKQSEIVIFEICPKAARRLQAAVLRKGYKCLVIHGDLLQGLRDLASQGEIINYVEFDGVAQFGRFEFSLYQIAKDLQIPILICEGSSRGQIDIVKKYAKQIGVETELNHGYKCFKLEQVAPKMIANKMRGYYNEFFTYYGVSNMYMQISIQKEVA